MARVERLRVYPVKGLDGHDLPEARVRQSGTIARDRRFALVDGDGAPVSAKQFPALHELRADHDPAAAELAVRPPDGDARRFDLEVDRAAASEWFAAYLDAPVTLARDDDGFVDRPDLGPSVVSTATVETVASWFDGLDADGVRRRLRANVEVGGVEAFWEDRFLGDGAPAFEAGGVRVEGGKPCGRCVVPARDPDTGDPLPGFRERFVAKRRATLPEWVDESAFDHLYAVMLIARVHETGRGGSLRVGDPVRVVESPG